MRGRLFAKNAILNHRVFFIVFFFNGTLTKKKKNIISHLPFNAVYWRKCRNLFKITAVFYPPLLFCKIARYVFVRLNFNYVDVDVFFLKLLLTSKEVVNFLLQFNTSIYLTLEELNLTYFM